MMHWLIPRLGSFRYANPKADIRLNVNYGMIDFIKDEISIAIRLDHITPPKEVIVEPLIREEIGPVCSPSYLERHSICHREDLRKVRLLGSATRPDAWQEWAAATDLARARSRLTKPTSISTYKIKQPHSASESAFLPVSWLQTRSPKAVSSRL